MSKKEIEKIRNKLKLYLVLHHINLDNYLGEEKDNHDIINFCHLCKIRQECAEKIDIKRYWSNINFDICKYTRAKIAKISNITNTRYRCIEWIIRI